MKTTQPHLMNAIVALTAFSFLFAPCEAAPPKLDNTVIPHFELEKFLGKWYEIARFDHKFERDLHYVTAEYSLREDGKVKVLNTGYKNGEKKQAEGKAKIVEPELQNGYLKVAFFLFFYADYRILLLDDDYQYALIGSKKDNYLWIMSRTPELDEDIKYRILREARRRGYDTHSLIWVRQ